MSNPTVGEIPDHWEFTTLGEVCDRGGGNIQTGPFGSQLHASDYVEEGIPSIMPVNIGDNRLLEKDIKRITEEDAQRLSKHLVVPGDIIYSRRGDVERRALVREEQRGWFCGTGCIKVRLGEGVVDPAFASFYLDHPNVREWIVQHAVGATMPNLNTSIMKAIPFAVPPPEEQRAIASILGALDDKIELNRRMNATLESLARAIFKSWFVDFDPVKVNAGQMPASSQALATHAPKVLDLFPSTFQDSELGPIPEGWGVGKFSQNIAILSGGTPKTKVDEYWNGNIPWYTVKDAPEGGDVWVIDTERKVSQLGIDNSAAEVFKAGTCIISARGTVGKIALLGVPMSMNQSCYGIKGVNGYGDLFTYYQLILLTELLQQNTHGTVFDTITRTTFEAVECVHPPSPLAAEFDNIVTDLLDQIRRNLTESAWLAATRDTLLPNLLSGELAIPEAFTATEEALLCS